MVKETISDIGSSIRLEGHFTASTQVYASQHNRSAEFIDEIGAVCMDTHGCSRTKFTVLRDG
jgi:hypothetical protein